MRGVLVASFLVAIGLGVPSRALAQEQPLQSANGAAIYLAALEGTLLVEVPFGVAIAATNGSSFDQMIGCMVFFPLCVLGGAADSTMFDMTVALLAIVGGVGALLVVPPIFGGVGGNDGWDVDGSLGLTSGVHGLAAGGLLGAGLGSLGDSPELGTVLGGVLGAAGSITYTALRLDMLAREPRVGVEANLLMWAPPTAMLLAGLIAALAEMDGPAAMVFAGLVGLLAQGVAITLTEVAIANP